MAGIDASWAVQVGVFDALADTEISGVSYIGVGGTNVAIYDGAAPSNSAFPYIVLGEMTVIPAESKANDGQEHTVQIHVWDRPAAAGGPIGYKRTKEIMAAARAALHQVSLSVSGHGVAFSRVEWQETLLDEDGVTRHGMLRARIRTSPA